MFSGFCPSALALASLNGLAIGPGPALFVDGFVLGVALALALCLVSGLSIRLAALSFRVGFRVGDLSPLGTLRMMLSYPWFALGPLLGGFVPKS